MQTLLGAHFHQTLLFDDVSLNLNPGGIVTVSGKNLNVRQNGVEADSNGVGKSVLFSSLSNVLYERGALHESAKSKKDLYGDAIGCSRVFHRTEDGVEYCYEQSKSGRYTVYENGKPLKHDKVANSVTTMQTLLPISEDAWHHLVVLSSSHPTPFLMAKPEARRSFFSTLFNFSYYDELLLLAKKQISEKSKIASKLEGYASSIETMRNSLSQIEDVDEDQLNEDVETLQELQERLNATISITEFGRVTKRITELEADLEDDAVDEDVLTKANLYLEKTAHSVENLAEEVAAARSAQKAWREYLEDKEEFETCVKQLSSELDLSDNPSVDELNALLELATHDVATAQVSSLSAVQALGLNKKAIKEFRRDYKTYTELKSQASDLKRALDANKKLLENIEGHSTCPFCASEVDPNVFVDERVRLKAEYATVLSALDDSSRAIDALKAYATELFDNSFCTSLTDGTDWCTIEKVQSKKQVLRMLRAQAARLQSKKPEVEQDVTLLEKRLKQTKDKRRQAQEYIAYSSSLAGKSAELRKLRKKIHGVDAAQLEADFDRLLELKKSVEDRQRSLDRRKHCLSMISQIKRDSSKEAKVLEDIPALELLVKAYSTKGLRLNAIGAITQQLTRSLNENAHMLFSEPFHFDVNLTDSRFDIIADRSPEASDVRKLSKSEQRRFAMLFSYCLNELVPPSRRSNIIVLDEMEDGSSDVNRKLYREVFLPHLNSMIPNVFVVSPLRDMQDVPGARTLFVVKDGDSSHVETEHPELVTPDVEYPIGD